MSISDFIQPLGRAFLAYVLAAREHAADLLEPQPGSQAAIDLAAESDLSNPGWERPVVHIDSLASLSFHGAIDHARLLATALAHMNPPPIWADRSILRSILEMNAATMWLYEPGISTEERIRRSLKLDKRNSANKEKAAENLGDAGTADVKTERARQHRVDAYARSRRWALSNIKMYRLADHVAAVTHSDRASPGGVALWHVTSGTSHGDAWALALVLDVVSDSPDQVVGGLTISAPKVAQSIAFAVASLHAAALARLDYYGIEPPDPLVAAHAEWARLWLLRDGEIKRAAAQ